jgi:UDP-glucose 4-epimerase
MVIPRFVQQALRNEPLTVYGDGSQSRAFAHVSDVVGALIALMDAPAAEGQVFNVGNDTEITIAELARLIIAKSHSTSELKLIPFEQAYDSNFEDLARRVPDLRKLKSLTGYQPRYTIDQIIEEVVSYFREGSTWLPAGT